ncbi:MAG: hypothetical protein ABUK01_07330 [Leptospirales bacterium]
MKIVSVVARIFIFLAYYMVAEAYLKEIIYYPESNTTDLVGWNIFFYRWVWFFSLLALSEVTWLAIKKRTGNKPQSWQPASKNKPEKTADVVIPRPTVEREENSQKAGSKKIEN